MNQSTDITKRVMMSLLSRTQAIDMDTIIILVILIILVLLMSLLQRRHPLLANAYWGGFWEYRTARSKAERQQQTDELEFSLNSGNLPVTDAQRSIFVSGMPGSGKSYSVIVPAILDAIGQDLPTIVYDFAYPELSTKIAAYAQFRGYDLHIFAPGYEESGILNPVDILENEEDIDTARQLVRIASENQSRQSSHGNERFFTRGGVSLAEGALAFAKGTKYTDVMMASAILELPQLVQRIQHSSTINPWVRQSFAQLIAVADSEKTVASLIGSAQDIFKDFLRPRYLGALCGFSTIPLCLEGKKLLILGVDRPRRAVVAPIIASILDFMVAKNATPYRQKPIFIALDEAPSLYLPYLNHYIAENRKFGMSFLLGVQNHEQLSHSYSHELAQSIFSTCGTKILVNPGEYNSAKLYSDLLGDVQVNYWQRTTNRGGSKASHSFSPQHRTKKLWEPAQFLKMQEGRAVVVSPGFSNRKEGFIPLKHRFRLSELEQKAIAYSQSYWHQLRDELANNSPQRPITNEEMLLYRQEAETLLPLPR